MLRIRLNDQVESVIRKVILSGQFGRKFTQDNVAGSPTILVTPGLVLTWVSDTDVRPFVVLKTNLIGADKNPIWTTRYIASTGGARPLAGKNSWTEKDSTILVDTANIINCTGIIISNAGAAITFSTGRTIVFANAVGAITFTGAGALAINGAFGDAGFDFATTASGRTLTITSATNTLNSTTASNRVLLGNGNTLNIVAGGTPSINSVVVSGTATVDIDAAATITALNNTGATW